MNPDIPQDLVVDTQTDRLRGKRSWGPWLLAGIAVAIFIAANRRHAVPEGWSEDFTAAMAEARSGGRLALLDFHMAGCAPCVAMDRLVLTSEPVKKAVSDMVRVRVDAVRNPDAAERYGVMMTPTFIVVDPQGVELERCQGFQEIEAFLAFLDNARKR